MLEITINNQDDFEYYLSEGKVYKDSTYDFTFENRFMVYHAPGHNQICYYALDRKTSRSVEVCRRKNDVILPHEFRSMIPDILWAIKYIGDTRYINSMNVDPYELIDTIFKEILPLYNYTVREEQIRLCKKMYDGLVKKQVSICEAEVGTGKSLAYLVAAFCAKNINNSTYANKLPITITTSSIELQKAIVEKEIPLLSKMLMEYRLINRPLTSVLRKGKEHYFCRFRFEDHLKNIQKYPEKFGTQIKFLVEKDFAHKAFDLDKIKIPGALKGKICVKGNCGKCKYANECKYNQFVEMAMSNEYSIDFQVTNHNLYINSMKNRGVLRRSSFVVIDEAHKFKEAAQEAYGESISEAIIPKYLNWAKTKCRLKADIPQFCKLQKMIEKKNTLLFDKLRELICKEDMEDAEAGTIIELDDKTISLIVSLSQAIDAFESLKTKKNGRCEINGKQLSKSLIKFCSPSEINIWIEIDENGLISLCCCPKNIGAYLFKDIWNKECSHVLTSGTMSDGTDFEFFKKEIGLNRISKFLIDEASTPSPFDYKNHTRLYIPDDLPIPNNDSNKYISAVSDRIVELVNATNGHTAILFTSYKVLHAVYELTKERLSQYDVICMTRSNKTAISDFKKSKNGVLFASGSMWEGVDCVGDTLSSVIIVRLPFPRRCATMEQKKNECENVYEFVQEYAVPEMLIKLRQGAGRLIRCESDTGVLTILDARASINGAYRDRVLTSLEKYPLINSIDHVSKFMRAVKSPEYFEQNRG